MKHIKLLAITMMMALMSGLALSPVMASALAAPVVVADLKADANGGLGQVGGGGINVENIFSTVLEILSIVVGGVAIIMIVFSGFKYITSGGDANRVSSAKNTLVYAMIGVAVAALASFFVHVVLNRTASL